MHRTLSRCVRCGECAGLHSPDAGTVSLQCPVRCVRCSARHALGHRTLKPASGGLPISKPLYVLVWWSPDASGATLGAPGDPAAGTYNPRLGVSRGSSFSSLAIETDSARALASVAVKTATAVDSFAISGDLKFSPAPDVPHAFSSPSASCADLPSCMDSRFWVSSWPPAHKVFA